MNSEDKKPFSSKKFILVCLGLATILAVMGMVVFEPKAGTAAAAAFIAIGSIVGAAISFQGIQDQKRIAAQQPPL
jgi:hypothetical protein